MKLLSEHIAEMQAILAQHGDIQVVKHDCEWGLEIQLNPQVAKVFKEGGHLVHHTEDMIAMYRAEAKNHPAPEFLFQSYCEYIMDQDGVDEEFLMSLEEFTTSATNYPFECAKTVKKYDEAPYMVVL